MWENPSQEFQRRPEDLELAVDFAFKNTGTQPVTIEKIHSSCGCTTASLAKKTYSPGESGTVTAKFVFGGRRGAQAKSVTVVTDDKKTTQLSFKCQITDEPVSLFPSFVHWRVGDPAEAKQVEVALVKDPIVRITSVASTNPRISASLTPAGDDGNQSIAIRPADTAKTESAQIFVQTDFPSDGPKAYTIHVRIK
jgi:hypothetical protein